MCLGYFMMHCIVSHVSSTSFFGTPASKVRMIDCKVIFYNGALTCMHEWSLRPFFADTCINIVPVLNVLEWECNVVDKQTKCVYWCCLRGQSIKLHSISRLKNLSFFLIFQAEWEALEMCTHKWALEGTVKEVFPTQNPVLTSVIGWSVLHCFLVRMHSDDNVQ